MRKLGTLVAAAGFATVVAVGPVSADLAKCHSGIEKNGQKLQAAILKVFTKCKDSYRKANGDPTLLATAATGCQGGLNKALDFGNDGLVISAMEKTLPALQKLTALLTCTDDDLSKLGYPAPHGGLFGHDRWARLVLLAALKGAYETQSVLIADFPNIMQDFGDTSNCPLCATLSTPPCVTSVCTLSAASVTNTHLAATDITRTLLGSTVIAGCEWQNVLNDPANGLNEIGLIGTANNGLKPTCLIGGCLTTPGPTSAFACNLAFRSMGFISCGGASDLPKVNTAICQDSLIGGTEGANECAMTCNSGTSIGLPCTTDDTNATTGCPSGTCPNCCTAPDQCNDDPDPTTGGACAKFTSAGTASEGDTFVISTTRLRITTDIGPDGIRCSDDDTLTETAPASIPVTTGTAVAAIVDYHDLPGNQTKGPISGAPGPTCVEARAGINTGRKLVGAFPAAEMVPPPTGAIGDTVSSIILECN